MTHWIYKLYQNLASQHKVGLTLKTDAWQEHKGDGTHIDADVYLEILPDVASKARGLGFDVKEGNILAMPFENETFDSLIDTSTIDHVEDYSTALSEYHRVLKPGSVAMVVYWSSGILPSKGGEKDAAGGEQHYFNRVEFNKEVLKYFEILDEKVLWPLSSENILIYLSLRRK